MAATLSRRAWLCLGSGIVLGNEIVQARQVQASEETSLILETAIRHNFEAATSRAYPPRLIPYPSLHPSLEFNNSEFRNYLLEDSEPSIENTDAILESICGGVDDSQDVELYDGTLGITKEFVNSYERPVGQIQWNGDLRAKFSNPGNVNGVRWGSGALVGNNLFLTAGHCFDPENLLRGWKYPRSNTDGSKLNSVEIAKNMHVNFEYQRSSDGVLKQGDPVKIVNLLEYRLGNLDYALLELEGTPGEKYGTYRLASSDAKLGETITIMGHPLGVPKRVMAGPVSDFYDTRIGYNTLDTQGGNSGANIIDLDGSVVGVHTNGGCDDIAVGHNYGHRITSLLAVSPTLADLVESGR